MAKKITFTGTTRDGQTITIESISALTHASIGISTGKQTPASWGRGMPAENVHFLQSTHRSENAARNSVKSDGHKKFMVADGYVSSYYVIELTAK